MPQGNFWQFALATEATPGNAETLDAGDVLVDILDDASADAPVEFQSQNIVTAYGSRRPATPTTKRITLSNIRYELRGPGTALAVPSAVPAIRPLWAAALLKGYQARRLHTGEASKVFTAGEIVTFSATPAETGIVLESVTTTVGGTLHVAFLTSPDTVPSALDASETIVGESGQTCTSNGTLTAGGYAFLPATVQNDAAGHHATARLNRDGYAWTARGGLSEIEWTIDSQGSIVVKQDFVGAVAVNPGTQALFTVGAVPESTVVPPRSLCPQFTIGGYTPECQGVVITKPNGIDAVQDFNDCNGGIKFAGHDIGEPTLTVTVAQVPTATKDYFGSLIGGGTELVKLTVGSLAGSTWKYIFPAAQLRTMSPTSVTPNRAAFDLNFVLTGTQNNEIIIIQE